MHGVLGFAVKHKRTGIRVFGVLYALIVVVGIIGARSIVAKDDSSPQWYLRGIWVGRLALTSFIITTIPGIARRFGIKHTIPAVILVFRRQFGILMYILASVHYVFVRGISLFIHKELSLPRPLFESIGFLAFLLTFPLFLTSNNFSERTLGRYWHKVHSLSYVIVWLIFLHTGLQRWSIWSIAIGTIAILSLASHVYRWYKNKVTLPISL